MRSCFCVDSLVRVATLRTPLTLLLSWQEMFPDAQVKAKTWSPPGRDMVQIKSAGGVEIAKVMQRDLYRKYQWPAKKEIMERLQMYKEEMES